MNAEHKDEECVGLRVSGHSRQNNDPPPEFTGTKPSEFKNHREKVKLWLLFAHSSSATRATCYEQADRPNMGCL